MTNWIINMFMAISETEKYQKQYLQTDHHRCAEHRKRQIYGTGALAG